MTPTPVIRFSPPSQSHQQPQFMHTPQSPGGMGQQHHQSWVQMGGTPQTPVTSREPRLYSSRVTSPTNVMNQSGRVLVYPQSGMSHHQGTPHQGSGPGPSSRMDTSFAINRPVTSIMEGQGQPSNTSPQTSAGQFGHSDQDLIEHAARTTDRLMNNELRAPSLYNSLMIQAQDPHVSASAGGLRQISGFMDHDYPPVVLQRIMTEKQYTIVHNAPIPPELSQMINKRERTACRMGLFPEIYRAWLAIESDLYLWDFRDGSDLSFYDGLKESIITMSLVPAKPNVFNSSIKHLLCVSTPSQVTILGFVVTDPTTQVLELLPKPIFEIPSDNLNFLVVYGMTSGRIFLGAANGTVHEIGYQAGRGWFQDRCWRKDLSSGYLSTFFKFINPNSQGDALVQIVGDDERHILYTRSFSGALCAYDLGSDGNGFRCIGNITLEGIVNEVIKVSKKTLEPNLVKKVLTISVVKMGEICLVAILESGVRLYFTCYEPLNNVSRDISTTRPNVFQLIHIRLPPGHCPATTQMKPAVAHLGYSSSGIFALASQASVDQDSFWMISPLLYPTQCLSEVFYVHKLPGHAVAIEMLPNLDYDLSLQRVPDVVTQHLKWQKQVVVLTNCGSVVFRANKPYEILRSTMLEMNGPENIKGHFDLGLGREYPLSNSLLLAIHPFGRGDQMVYEMAVRALFLYGNYDNPVHQRSFEGIQSPHDRSLEFNPNIVSTPRQEGSQPMFSQNEPPSYISPPVAGTGFMGQGPGYSSPMQQGHGGLGMYENFQWQSSPRHDAIYLVVGRILYEFWHRPLVKSETMDQQKVLVPNVNGEEVTYATAFLHSILVFLNENPSLCMIRTMTPAFGTMNLSDGRAQDFERNSLNALKNFLNITLEVLGMWKILCDHQFHIVLHGLDERLQATTMRQLILNGQNTVSVIINALISKYLGDNAAVDAISLRLREVCPTLFRNEDAIGSKVAEILAKCRNVADLSEKEALLKESLILSEKISGHSRININNFCLQYGELGFPVGAVRLVASSAKAADPDLLALNVVKSTSANNDPANVRAFQNRTEIYKVVFDMLDRYVSIATSTQSPVPLSKDDVILPARAQQLADDTIHAILTSDDETFHINLYNWLLERKLFDRLLEIKHGFLDSFLQRAADAVTTGKWPGGGSPANDTRVLDLLWRHHEMNNNHSAAAQILSRLAESTTTGLNLQQRLEYLSRAIICCKSSSRRGDLLEMLEDKLEVARIQKSILEAINLRICSLTSSASEGDRNPEIKLYEDAVEKLNSQLMNITQLYGEFANPLKLNEAKLEIFHVAGHPDIKAVETVWSDIIEGELSAISRRPIDIQMDLLARKLVSIGRKYIGFPAYFPIEFLVEHLESMKPQEARNVCWVFKIMMDIGVTFWDVLIIYEKLWKRLNTRENTSEDEMLVARVIINMIDMYARNEIDLKNAHRIKLELLEKCKQLIAHMTVEFSGRTDDTRQIKLELDRVQDRLDRCRVD